MREKFPHSWRNILNFREQYPTLGGEFINVRHNPMKQYMTLYIFALVSRRMCPFFNVSAIVLFFWAVSVYFKCTAPFKANIVR